MVGVSVAATDRVKLQQFLFDVGNHLTNQNEIIFSQPVSLKQDLIAIVVTDDNVHKFIERLVRIGVSIDYARAIVRGESWLEKSK